MEAPIKLFNVFKAAFLLNKPVDPEIYRANIQRIRLALYGLIPLHTISIAVFWSALTGEGIPADDTIYRWRTGIIAAHSIMLLLSLLLLTAVTRIKTRKLEGSAAGRFIPVAAAASYLLFGAVVCVIDQAVTESINPYLVSNLGIALLIILHPYRILTLYPASALAFYFALPLTRANGELLLSIRVNGISAAAIGMTLALLMWRTNALAFSQKRLIESYNEELKKKNSQLTIMARTDMLTGLYNRMRFTEFVERELARIRRTGENSCLILMDIDNFKQVNDRYGHPSGDVVLKWIAGILKGELRETDIIARLGGDEFIIMLPGTSLQGAQRVAEKIRQTIEQCTFTGPLEDLQILASFGVAQLGRDEESSYDRVYSAIDKALYRAKNKGRNRTEVTEELF